MDLKNTIDELEHAFESMGDKPRIICKDEQTYPSGAFRVSVDSIETTKNIDHTYVVTLKLTRLNDGKNITIPRTFIQEYPYGYRELYYDAIHDFFEICGIPRTKEMVQSEYFNVESFNEHLEKAKGKELIVLITSIYKIPKNSNEVVTASKLILATTKDGISLRELKGKETTRQDLIIQFLRLCPITTKEYLKRKKKIPKLIADNTLMLNEFKEYIDAYKEKLFRVSRLIK